MYSSSFFNPTKGKACWIWARPGYHLKG